MIWNIGLFVSYAYESNNSLVEPLIGYHITDTAVTTICHLLASFTKLRYYMTSIDLEMAFIFFFFSARFSFYYFSAYRFVMLTPVQCLYYPVTMQVPPLFVSLKYRWFCFCFTILKRECFVRSHTTAYHGWLHSQKHH